MKRQTLSYLQSIPVRSEREHHFSANKEHVRGTPSVRSVDHLRVIQTESGSRITDRYQPLIEGERCVLDLNQTPYTSSSSIKDSIVSLCHEQNINIESIDINHASCVFVAAALAGRHDDDDADCSQSTSSQFIPAFQSTKNTNFYALSSVPGQISRRIDGAYLTGEYCWPLDGSSSSDPLMKNKVFDAIEVSNLEATEIQTAYPALGKTLSQQACQIVIMEFDEEPVVQKKIPARQTSFFKLESLDMFNEPPVSLPSVNLGSLRMRDDTRGAYPQEIGVSTSSTRSCSDMVSAATHQTRVSVNSLVKLSSSQFNRENLSIRYQENPRRLKSISVYIVAPVVVNTNGLPLVPGTIEQSMRTRVNQVSDIYAEYKIDVGAAAHRAFV